MPADRTIRQQILKLPSQPHDILGDKLGELLDKHTQHEIDTNFRDQGFFHCSTIGSCPRKTTFERLGIVKNEPISIRSQGIFSLGHKIHEMLQANLFKSGVLIQAEVPVHLVDYNLRGNADGIGVIVLPERGGTQVVIEIKSVGIKSFVWQNGGSLPGETKVTQAHGPDLKHVYQVQLYMFCLGISYAIIILYCKDNSEQKYYTVKLDRELVINKLLPIVSQVNKAVQEHKLPPRDKNNYPYEGFECSYCPYRSKCQEEELTGIFN